jgi:hypothetical protein
VTTVLAVEPGDHIGTSFASDSQFAGTTITFADQAVAASAQVMIFPGDPDPDDLVAFQQHLSDQSRTVGAAARRGQVQVCDSGQVQMAPGRFDPVYLHQTYAAATRRAVAEGYQGLWVSVDMSWATGVDPDALVQFEADASDLFTSRELTAVCQYDRRIFPEAQVTAACRAHPAGPEDEPLLRHERLDNGRTLRLSGDADLSNSAAFAALMRKLRPGETLDITAMTFLDVRSLSTIVQATAQIPGLAIKASPAHTRLLDLIRAGYPI